MHISLSQELSEDFIENYKDLVDFKHISVFQNLSDKFLEKYGLKSDILKSVFYCDKYNSVIYRSKLNPELINIFDFRGTKVQAIAKISKEYYGKTKLKYIDKINECFED